MTHALVDSYAACEKSARRAAKNFYYSFLTLPGDKRRAMCALYAFFRRTDDLGDDEPGNDARGNDQTAKQQALVEWRAAWHAALRGEFRDPLLPAIVDTVRRYAIPPEYFETTIDGVASDLVRTRFATFDELADYCYQVASVVGLASIHVWGFRREAAAFEAARSCGIAFQLTNILRDVREDAERGRIYLPQDELARFALTETDLFRGAELVAADDRRWRDCFAFQSHRAEGYYRDARRLLAYLDRDGLSIFAAMFDIYHGLLQKMVRRNGDVFSQRITLPAWQKTWIAARHLLRRPTPPPVESASSTATFAAPPGNGTDRRPDSP